MHGSGAGKGHHRLDRFCRLVKVVVQVQDVAVLAPVYPDAAVLDGELGASHDAEVPQTDS
jgi:hypothetical protein